MIKSAPLWISCSHQPKDLSTKKNECYSLRQLNDPVYDDASSTQPNYSSLGPDMEGVKFNYQVTNGYDSIENMTKSQTKFENLTPKTEDDLDDAEQHTSEVVNANMKEKAQKKSDKRNQQKTNAQETLANFTSDEASKKGNDFYDTEVHIYSAVNKRKKKAKEKPPENDELERKVDYQ